MAFAITENTTRYFTDNKIDLPRFQRKATWKDVDNFQLCISVFKGYPIGVIIINELGQKKYLLDGRQRRNALITLYNNPIEVYRWASKFIGIKSGMSADEVRDRFSEKTSEYLKAAFDSATAEKEDPENNTEDDECAATTDSSVEGKTFDSGVQNVNMQALLDLILLVHGKYSGSNTLEGMFKFNKIIPTIELDYGVVVDGEEIIDPSKLKKFIRDRIDRDECDQSEFIGYLVKRHKLNNSDEEKIKSFIRDHWEYFSRCFSTIRRTDEIITNAKIGLIRLIDASPLDAQNIFSLVNKSGMTLTAEELLSARPFWNIKIQNPSYELQQESSKLYKFLGVECPENVVRWDACATILSRIDKSHLIFDDIDILKIKSNDSAFTKKLTLGFKLLSAVKIKGISSESVKDLENEKKVSINWDTDIETFIKEFNIVMDLLYDCDFFKYLIAWKQSIMSLMSNAVALEFAALVYYDWKYLNKPLKGQPNLIRFQKDAIILFDNLVYEYSNRLWVGSSDSRLATHLVESVVRERFKVVSYDKWDRLIDSFRNSVDNRSDKGLIYYYYFLKKIRPVFDGVGANAKYEIDHIYAQAQFKTVTTIDVRLMNSLGNKALLPKLDNIEKGDKTLAELRFSPWLYEEVKRVTGIEESDIDKFSDITNIDELIDMRIKDYKRVFEQERISLLNSALR